MSDHARSSSPPVQAQLDRLRTLSPGADILGLERITALLARLGDPHLRLPPAFHIAGTNGKGSTCAFLRAALEAAGHRVHVYTSPHLCRFNERIRLAGALIEDNTLAALLEEVLDAAGSGAGDIGASFFEVTTAAAFLAFARAPADACIIEVGLGGRLDATNVIPAPAVCGIAALGVDHQSFLGDTLLQIAAEKAGIAKPGVPLVTMDYSPPVAARIAKVATAASAKLVTRGEGWQSGAGDGAVRYTDSHGTLAAPLPRLAGAHQANNYALAIAMLRHQHAIHIPLDAIRAAAADATWPARMQRLGPGPLTARYDPAGGVWVDGAHNPSAAEPIAAAWRTISRGRPAALVIGMLVNKDAETVLAILAPVVDHILTVPIEGHDHHDPSALAAIARAHEIVADVAPTLADALNMLASESRAHAVPIAGSLYLAGEALAANDKVPT